MVIYLQVVLRCSTSTGSDYSLLTTKAVDPALPPPGLDQTNNVDDNHWN